MLLLAACEKASVEQHVAPVPEPPITPESTKQKVEALEQNAAAGNKIAPRSETLKQPEAQALDPTGREPLDDALTCLARTVYWEARGEGETSMEAIANVVMNRLGTPGVSRHRLCGGQTRPGAGAMPVLVVVRRAFGFRVRGRPVQVLEGDRPARVKSPTNGSNGGCVVLPSPQRQSCVGGRVHQNGRTRRPARRRQPESSGTHPRLGNPKVSRNSACLSNPAYWRALESSR